MWCFGPDVLQPEVKLAIEQSVKMFMACWFTRATRCAMSRPAVRVLVLQDKRNATKKYKDTLTELSITRAKADKELDELRENLRLAHCALDQAHWKVAHADLAVRSLPVGALHSEQLGLYEFTCNVCLKELLPVLPLTAPPAGGWRDLDDWGHSTQTSLLPVPSVVLALTDYYYCPGKVVWTLIYSESFYLSDDTVAVLPLCFCRYSVVCTSII